MNSRLDIGKLQGSFSTYSLNPEHKQRLENFIKRSKPSEPCKLKGRNKSPGTRVLSADREILGYICSKNPRSNEKERELAERESLLYKKELELKEKEKNLIEISEKILGQHKEKEVVERARLTPSPINRREKLLTGKIETLISAEAEIDQLRQKIMRRVNSLQDKVSYLQKSVKDAKDKNFVQKKKLTKNLCAEIVLELIPLAIIQSTSNTSIDLESRINAVKSATNKLKKIEVKLNSVKSGLEKRALSLISLKSELCTKSEEINSKSDEISEISQSITRSEKSTIQKLESLKKREESLSHKNLQISQLEKQIQDQELSLLVLSKQKVEASDKASKINENTFFSRENAIKQKESELKERKKILEEKKNSVDEIKSKIRWRINNIVSMEKKSEKLKMEVESKAEEFENFVKNEEKALECWREKVKKKERELDELKSRCKALESKAKKEAVKGFDSVESFERVEKEVQKSQRVERFTDFAKSFQQRQYDRSKEYDEISREKKLISEKLSSILKLQ